MFDGRVLHGARVVSADAGFRYCTVAGQGSIALPGSISTAHRQEQHKGQNAVTAVYRLHDYLLLAGYFTPIADCSDSSD